MTENEVNKEYSPDNWAHQALLKMDEAETLVRFAATQAIDADRYERGSAAFWAVCQMLADERDRLHNTDYPER